MILRLLCLLTVLLLSAQAKAETFIDLTLTLSNDLKTIHVEGRADHPVTLPGGESPLTEFSYKFDLASSGSFRQGPEGEYIFLPSGWHPFNEGLLTYQIQLNSEGETIPVIAGEFVSETQTESTYQADVRMMQPVESIALFAGPYEIERKDHNGLEIRTYFDKALSEFSETYLNRTAQYIARFEQQIGPFPFAGFNIVSGPLPVGLGFAGMTYMGERVLPLPFIPETSLGHEILHNYFGNGIFPDYESGNWAEGLTTYMSDYMTAEQTSASKARDMRLGWLRDYNALPKEREQPLTAFRAKHSQASQVLGYSKVAFIFHMLRRELGDETFLMAIQTLWRDYAFKTASWKTLETVFSDVSNQDLSAFFRQWVHGTGAPSISGITAQIINKGHIDGWKTRVSVIQNKPVFYTRLPVRLSTREGFVERTVQLSKMVSLDQIELANRPTALSVDPDFHLFRQLGHDEAPAILRDVMLATSPGVFALGFNAEEQKIVERLAGRFFESAHEIKVAGQEAPDTPFLIAGLLPEIQTHLKKWHLPQPDFLEGTPGQSHIWAARLKSGQPYLVIGLHSIADLKALLRILPHYGRQNRLHLEDLKVVGTSMGQTRPITLSIH